MHEVRYRPRAELDLQSIVLYASEVLRAPAAARDAYEKIRAAIARLREFPAMGRLFRDDLLEAEYRWVLADSYRIFYTIDADTIIIWRIVHTRQDIDDFAYVDW